MTDNLPTVDDFASYPHTTDDVTARRLAEYMAVEAHWSASLNMTHFRAMAAAEASGDNFADLAAHYNLNQALMSAEHSVSFLLRVLIEHLPDKADEIAVALWNDWEDPPLLALTWTALESLGIDPEAVEKAALQRFHTVRNGQTPPASPEVHPGQPELPLGGEA
ncbi:hypothetical protein AB0F17_08745 [Nonomuraea sp. NPDC026600]|uniref:hypothetical protein n=1 Tax=Nonomuraea sp. NPDC026600 TaxID=3155363 RepID=UPI0033E5744B